MATSDANPLGPQKLALVVCNDNYRREGYKLQNSIKHAMELTKLLEKIGFTVTPAENITQEDKLTDLVKAFVENIKKDDLVLIYFSGHGCWIQRNYYLIPVHDERINSSDNVVTFGTDVRKILKRLAKPTQQCTAILILDCCRPYVVEDVSTPDSETDEDESLETKVSQGTFIQFSCAANETTKDDLFIKHLLRNIDRENVPAAKIFQDISDDVCHQRHTRQRLFSIGALPANGPTYLNQKELVTRSPENRQKRALIIGNDNYSRPENQLTTSIENSTALNILLEKINFEVIKGDDVKSEDDIMQRVKDFTKTFVNGDLALFYYSGHAVQVDNKNYLIPTSDTRINSDENVETFGANLNRILQTLIENKPLCVVILILDCCRSFFRNTRSPSAPIDQIKGLHAMGAPDGSNIFIQFSCAANKTTRDDLFNKYLLRDIHKKNVPVTEVFQYITKNVHKDRNRRLKPFFSNGLPINEPIYLNQVLSSLPDIPSNSAWRPNARTMAGGLGAGSSMNRLHSPQGISISKSQKLVIADSLNHRIMRYNLDTGRMERIAGKNIQGYGSELLARPSNVVFEPESKSYIICDYHNRRVLQWFPRSRKAAKTIIGNIACFGLAIDDEGFIYVSDTEQHQVKRYRLGRKRGKVVAGGNGQGRRLHQLNNPTYICVGDDQSVYVSDSWNDRVVKWEKGKKEGVIVAGGEGKGRDRNQLDCPAGIVIDNRDTLYVADHWNNRVMRYRENEDPDIIAGHRFLSGSDINQLICPEGLAFDQDGNLYVADSNNHRIQRFKIRTA